MRIKLSLLFFILIFSGFIQANEKLFELMRSNNFNRFKALLEKEASPNFKNQKGNSLLHLSIEQGKKKFFDLLIQNGADVNVFDEQKNTALHWAVLEYNHHFAKVLIEKGADIHARNEDERTPLHFASAYGHGKRFHILRSLLKDGADINAKDKKENTPLHLSIVDGVSEKVDLLIKNGADVNAKNINGVSPIHEASRLKGRQYIQIVKNLIKAGADVNAVDNTKNTPILESIKNLNSTVTKHLANAGANLFVTDRYGKSPIDLVQVYEPTHPIKKIVIQAFKKKNKINRLQYEKQLSSQKAIKVRK